MNSSLPLEVEVLIIGGGPAGLSAATWLGRYQRKTLVVDRGEHRNRFTDRVHGLLGRDPVSPQALLEDARAGLGQYEQVLIHEGTVTCLDHTQDGRFLADTDGARVSAERVVLASGVRDTLPEISGIDEHYGTDVYHCPACDGHEIRGRTVIVLGAGEHVPAYAAELLEWAETVRIVTDSTEPAFEQAQHEVLSRHGIEVVEGVAEALIGAPGAMKGLQLREGPVIEADAVFFSYAHRPSNDLARRLGCETDEEGHVVVDAEQLTSVPGVYAIGDLTPGIQLVPIAISEGVAAGVACATSLRENQAVKDTEPAPPVELFVPTV